MVKLQNDIETAIKSGEMTLAIFADYSKFFNSIDFDILLRKMHKLNSFIDFLHWPLSYYSVAKRRFIKFAFP